MDDYIDGLKEQQQQQDKDEIKKLKATIEKQAIKLRENYNEITKLKDKVKNHSEVTQASLEGALQLRELLMSEHQGSTVGEMLGFCFKDITRDRDENAIMKKKKSTKLRLPTQSLQPPPPPEGLVAEELRKDFEG